LNGCVANARRLGILSAILLSPATRKRMPSSTVKKIKQPSSMVSHGSAGGSGLHTRRRCGESSSTGRGSPSSSSSAADVHRHPRIEPPRKLATLRRMTPRVSIDMNLPT
jgi:hypothetical protein